MRIEEIVYNKSKDALILSARDLAEKERSSMAGSRNKLSPLPEQIEDLVEFFDTHDMGEYWEHMPEADFEIDIRKRRHLVAIDEKLVARLTEVAKSKRLSSEKLVNTWVREKLAASK